MKRLLLFLLLAACDSPTDGGMAPVNVEGRWTYQAAQITPLLNMSGALDIDEQDGRSFNGTVTFTEVDAQGTQHVRAGLLTGRVLGDDVLDIDIYVDAQVRRHVGRLAADSITGTWSVTGAGAQSGSFTARRLP